MVLPTGMVSWSGYKFSRCAFEPHFSPLWANLLPDAGYHPRFIPVFPHSLPPGSPCSLAPSPSIVVPRLWALLHCCIRPRTSNIWRWNRGASSADLPSHWLCRLRCERRKGEKLVRWWATHFPDQCYIQPRANDRRRCECAVFAFALSLTPP